MSGSLGCCRTREPLALPEAANLTTRDLTNHNMQARRFLACLGILGFLASAVPAEAIRLRTTWGQRVDLAKRAVLGRVTRMASAWNSDRTSINTYVTVHVEEQLRGSGPEEVLIIVPGGKVEATTQWVSDVPHFTAGERYVILLNESGHVTSGPDGVFPMIRADSETFLRLIRAYVSGDPQAVKEGPHLGPGLPNR